MCVCCIYFSNKESNLFFENFRSKLPRSYYRRSHYFDGTVDLNPSWGFQDRNTSSVRSRVPRRELLARFQDEESRGNRRRRQTMLHRCLNLELGLIKILQADTQLGISRMLGKNHCLQTNFVPKHQFVFDYIDGAIAFNSVFHLQKLTS